MSLATLLSSGLSRDNNPLGSKSPLVSSGSRQTTNVSFLKVGSMEGLFLTYWRTPWFMVSSYSLKWRLSQRHAGTLTDRPLPFHKSPPVFWPVLHCEAEFGPQRTGGPSDTLTAKQPNFSFWGAEKKSLTLQAACIFGLCTGQSLGPYEDRNERLESHMSWVNL